MTHIRKVIDEKDKVIVDLNRKTDFRNLKQKNMKK